MAQNHAAPSLSKCGCCLWLIIEGPIYITSGRLGIASAFSPAPMWTQPNSKVEPVSQHHLLRPPASVQRRFKPSVTPSVNPLPRRHGGTYGSTCLNIPPSTTILPPHQDPKQPSLSPWPSAHPSTMESPRISFRFLKKDNEMTAKECLILRKPVMVSMSPRLPCSLEAKLSARGKGQPVN